MELAISTRGLRKTYRNRKGRHVAVQGLDLDVPVGGVHGFLGPNGSGKTTTIRMLLVLDVQIAEPTTTPGTVEWAGGLDAEMQPLTIRQGQRARLTFTNHTMMWHPMHLHGHTFQILKSNGTPDPRKDTVIVPKMRSIAVDLIADNPGEWMLHCHNAYHADAGMLPDWTTTVDAHGAGRQP